MRQIASSEIKALSILHFAMLLGQLLFAIIAAALVYSRQFVSPFMRPYSDLIISICVILGVVGYGSGSFLFKRKLDQINQGYKPLHYKLNEYRGASIIRWAFLEFAAFFCIILFFLTNDYSIMIITGALMILFISCRPTAQKIASDLKISSTELEQVWEAKFYSLPHIT